MQTTDTRTEIANAAVEQAVRAALLADAEAGPDYLTTLHVRVMARVRVTAPDEQENAAGLRLAPVILGTMSVLLMLIALLALTHLR